AATSKASSGRKGPVGRSHGGPTTVKPAFAISCALASSNRSSGGPHQNVVMKRSDAAADRDADAAGGCGAPIGCARVLAQAEEHTTNATHNHTVSERGTLIGLTWDSALAELAPVRRRRSVARTIKPHNSVNTTRPSAVDSTRNITWLVVSGRNIG